MFKFFYTFNKDQRRGIVALFMLIIIVQAGYFVLTSIDYTTPEQKSQQEKDWLALQSQINTLKQKAGDKTYKLYPFNPNFISDYKGYTLGMTVQEINRLHKFRETGKYINSIQDFKAVTNVSDSLLTAISPYFKFPDWVKNKQQAQKFDGYSKTDYNADNKTIKKDNIVLIDINQALEEDLDKVYGIGPAYAKKILRTRADLGGFVSMVQMDYFKEIPPEAVAGLKKYFKVTGNPQVNKININTASLKQLTYFTYFNKDIARAIVTQRSMKGKIKNIDEMLEISDFPVDKVDVIALYLEF